MIPLSALTLIKTDEGDKLTAYPDSSGIWTVGYGSTHMEDGTPVKQGDVITEDRALELLAFYLDKQCTPALSMIPAWNLMNDNQRGALYSFAYNCGAWFYGKENFHSMTVLCDSPDRWTDSLYVKSVFDLYDKAGGRAITGLLNRRTAEAEMFCTPIQEV